MKSMIFLLCAFVFACGAVSADGYKEIHTQELKAMLDQNPSVIVVDARSKPYDDGTRITGAILLTYDAADATIATTLPSKSATVVVYCSNEKCPAGKMLAERLVQMGYTSVYKYPEGIAGWMQAGYPTTSTKQ